MQIKINSLNINYIERGPNSKTNILLLHGWGANIASFYPIIEYLSKQFKVYAIDFPGFGLSQKPDKNYHVEDYSKVVLEFIQKKRLENVILIGHSFGGRVIIKLVGKLEYEPKKIILIDSAGIKPNKSFKIKIKEKVYKLLKRVLQTILKEEKAKKIINIYSNKFGSADYKNADEIMKEVFKNVIKEDLTKYLVNINRPTLLIWGEKDLDTPISDGKIMETCIPDAGMIIVPNAGHFSYLDNFNYFITVVNQFLKGCG